MSDCAEKITRFTSSKCKKNAFVNELVRIMRFFQVFITGVKTSRGQKQYRVEHFFWNTIDAYIFFNAKTGRQPI